MHWSICVPDISVTLLVIICLVDTCVPGDMVTVSGIVKVTNSDEGTCVVSRFHWYCHRSCSGTFAFSSCDVCNWTQFFSWIMTYCRSLRAMIKAYKLVPLNSYVFGYMYVMLSVSHSVVYSKCLHFCASATRFQKHLLDLQPHHKYTLACKAPSRGRFKLLTFWCFRCYW